MDYRQFKRIIQLDEAVQDTLYEVIEINSVGDYPAVCARFGLWMGQKIYVFMIRGSLMILRVAGHKITIDETLAKQIKVGEIE